MGKPRSSRSKGKKSEDELCAYCTKHYFKDSEIEDLRLDLLKWYDAHQRKLPWRDIAKYETDLDKRGYAVWVSEVMLQQTQVATVIPYYEKWLKKWPTAQDLAKSKLEEVNEMWAGLGYYSRARRLHEGSTIISNDLNGHIPQTSAELINLIPGIGQYTAAAVASVAYQQNVGLVDGNVSRVLSRLRVIGSEISKPKTRNHLWNLANSVVSAGRPGDFNQALMELGATVCTPRNPKCDVCPVNSICMAYSRAKSNTGNQQHGTWEISEKVSSESKKHRLIKTNSDEVMDIEISHLCSMCLPLDQWKRNPEVTIYPCKVKKKSPRKEKVAVVVVEIEGHFLMVQRPDKGLLASLWEFPSSVLNNSSALKEQNCQIENKLSELGIMPSISKCRKYIGEVSHIFSHIHTTYTIEYLLMKQPFTINRERMRLLTKDEIHSAAVPTAMKKILKALQSPVSSTTVKGKRKRTNSTHDDKQLSIKAFFK